MLLPLETTVELQQNHAFDYILAELIMPVIIMSIYDLWECFTSLYMIRVSVYWLPFICFRYKHVCVSFSSNTNVLCNIWWDYLQKLSSLEALAASSCRVRNTLIELIAFIVLIKLLNCVIWNKRRILEDFAGIVAHFSGSSTYGTHPAVKRMIGSKTVLSTKGREAWEDSEPGFLKIPRHHLLYCLSQPL